MNLGPAEKIALHKHNEQWGRAFREQIYHMIQKDTMNVTYIMNLDQRIPCPVCREHYVQFRMNYGYNPANFRTKKDYIRFFSALKQDIVERINRENKNTKDFKPKVFLTEKQFTQLLLFQYGR